MQEYLCLCPSHGAATQYIHQEFKNSSLVPAFSRDGNSHHQFRCMPPCLSIQKHTLRRIRENLQLFHYYLSHFLSTTFITEGWEHYLQCSNSVVISFTVTPPQLDCIPLLCENLFTPQMCCAIHPCCALGLH